MVSYGVWVDTDVANFRLVHIDQHVLFFFFFNDTATTEIYTLSLHDALPIYSIYVISEMIVVNRWMRFVCRTFC